ncbi:hypothetical protein FA15DRAFT_673788 [Coprinopsis marcescibilis]|uniref:Uncharacterized protein n=1 Tax=Coprinopsis marcescibilis TaxID=230819 RepID=A0A5C3KJ14_COPMA|nr:hypothetical protein FA15DRAFT_673788 [Coprinopsis marcescibilis]
MECREKDSHHDQTLPVELIEKIIEVLSYEAFPAHGVHMEDLPTTPASCPTALTAAFQCSLASHFFRSHFLPLMFYRINVSTVERLKDLLSILRSNPELTSHIVSLQLHENDIKESETSEKRERIEQVSIVDKEWFLSTALKNPSELAALFIAVSKAGVLREFSIVRAFNWSLLREVFPGSALEGPLHSLINQPQLRALQLRYITIPLEAAEWIQPTVEHFSADYVTFERQSQVSSDSSATKSTSSWKAIAKFAIKKRLYQLPFRTVQISDKVPDDLRNLPFRKKPEGQGKGSKFRTPLPNLDKMVVSAPILYCQPGGYEKAAILSPNLRTMELNIDHGSAEDLAFLRLKFSHLCVTGPFENLEIVRFIGKAFLKYGYFQPEDEDEVPGDISVFMSDPAVTQTCKLRTLTLSFRCISPRLHVSTERPLLNHLRENVGWEKLDEVLAGPFFRRLHKVTVDVRRFGIGSIEASVLESSVQSWIPRVQLAHGVRIFVQF